MARVTALMRLGQPICPGFEQIRENYRVKVFFALDLGACFWRGARVSTDEVKAHGSGPIR
jgi:hypothetical protein